MPTSPAARRACTSLRSTLPPHSARRCAALEAVHLTFLGAQGGNPVPVHQIQVAPDLQWAYYTSQKVLWAQQDPPLLNDPYYP